ncbi:hypothetical protein CEXT_631241 [Caerostris extrusa]|uniref:Uncharacterized protein n=1 Tax=Caerostris extrusa TaxID=172846 RepID=A0AAV4YBU7_CAEEX|nr:hypothetical protein CEXT_631241 [Caerostris extrusa]
MCEREHVCVTKSVYVRETDNESVVCEGRLNMCLRENVCAWGRQTLFLLFSISEWQQEQTKKNPLAYLGNDTEYSNPSAEKKIFSFLHSIFMRLELGGNENGILSCIISPVITFCEGDSVLSTVDNDGNAFESCL